MIPFSFLFFTPIYCQLTFTNESTTSSTFTTAEKTFLNGKIAEVNPTGKYVARQAIAVSGITATISSSVFTSAFTIIMPSGDTLTAQKDKFLSDDMVNNTMGSITSINGVTNSKFGNFAFTFRDNMLSGFLFYHNNYYELSMIKSGYSLLTKVNKDPGAHFECRDAGETSEPLTGLECQPESGNAARSRVLFLFDTQTLTFPSWVNTASPDWDDYLYLAFEAWPVANTFNIIARNSLIGENEVYPLYDFQSDFVYSDIGLPINKIDADVLTLVNSSTVTTKMKLNKCDAAAFLCERDYNNLGGVAYAIGFQPLNPNGLIVRKSWTIGPRFGFAHEFAHLNGARHSRDADNTDVCHHAILIELTEYNTYGTLLAVPSNDVELLPNFSNSQVLFGGVIPMGDVFNNNAAAIDDQLPRMAVKQPCDIFPSIHGWSLSIINDEFVTTDCDPKGSLDIYPCTFGPLETIYSGPITWEFKYYINNVLKQTSSGTHWDFDLSSYPKETLLDLKVKAKSTYYPLFTTSTIVQNFELNGYAIVEDAGCIGNGDSQSLSTGKTELVSKIYPNPATDQVTLLLKNPNADNQVQIMDINGKVLFKKFASNMDKVELATTGFIPGLYFISVSNGKAVSTHKLLIVK